MKQPIFELVELVLNKISQEKTNMIEIMPIKGIVDGQNKKSNVFHI